MFVLRVNVLKNTILASFVLLVSCTLNREPQVNNLLLGEWKPLKLETIGGDTVNWSGNRLQPYLWLRFKANGKVEDMDAVQRNLKMSDRMFNYSVNKDTMLIGSRYYIIDSLSNKILVLREHDPMMPNISSYLIHSFKKVVGDK